MAVAKLRIRPSGNGHCDISVNIATVNTTECAKQCVWVQTPALRHGAGGKDEAECGGCLLSGGVVGGLTVESLKGRTQRRHCGGFRSKCVGKAGRVVSALTARGAPLPLNSR